MGKTTVTTTTTVVVVSGKKTPEKKESKPTEKKESKPTVAKRASKVDLFDLLTVDDLKEMLAEQRLPTSGVKDDLFARLTSLKGFKKHLALEILSKDRLQDILYKHDLAISGNKPDLIDRLMSIMMPASKKPPASIKRLKDGQGPKKKKGSSPSRGRRGRADDLGDATTSEDCDVTTSESDDDSDGAPPAKKTTKEATSPPKPKSEPTAAKHRLQEIPDKHDQPRVVHVVDRSPLPKMAIALIFASYGGADVTNVVRGRLQQQGTLNFGPNQYHTWMGDPAPGQYKDFVVVSLDNSVHPNRFRVNLFEDHEPCQITPGPGPSSVRREPPHAREIVFANYGGRDVTQQVQQMFAQGGPAGLSFPQPPHMIFGDPLPGVVKALVIIYTS